MKKTAKTTKKKSPSKTSRKSPGKTAKKAAKKTTPKKAVASKTGKATKKPAKKATSATSKKKTAAKAKPITKPAISARKPIAKPVSKKKSKEKIPVKKLTPKELDGFREALIDMRNRLTGQVKSLRHDSLRRDDEVNTSEDGTDAFERQFALTLASSENEVIFEIDDALRRIEEKTYGVCEKSGELIERARLEAIPFTRYSLEAQAEIEKTQGPYRQSSVMKGL
ncbi:MAG: TraR/DksA family transcriptional regulator [Verrucomicrobia bacterium]|nr:TraR/DksA family transcriptional regulator [Verrucomicrobiota bacterium]